VKRYPGRDKAAVERLTFEVAPGEICVLIGPSGCGKTTALKMVNRLISISDGDITINGESVRSLELTQLRRSIGYVFQQIGLFPHMTVEHNIGSVPRLLGWQKARIRERASELLELVGLDPEGDLKRYPGEFSGGQQQRIGVARAMAADPEIMLMDEPFGAIDPIARDRLHNDFLRLHRQVRKTVIFVTHDIDEALKMGDKIAIMRDGRLVQLASADHLLASPADEFVARFVGEDRGLKRLRVRSISDLELDPPISGDASVPSVLPDTSLHTALSSMLAEGVTEVNVANDGGKLLSSVRFDSIARLVAPRERSSAAFGPARSRTEHMSLALGLAPAASGPVIPNFGGASNCLVNNHQFCMSWFTHNLNSVFKPALIQHIELTAIAVGCGMVIAFSAAIFAYKFHWFDTPFSLLSAFLYTIPSLALFELLVQVTGINKFTAEIGLVSYTLLILFRNTLTGLQGVPKPVIEAAQAMGYTPRQTLSRVEIPLASPAIMAGVRIATVTTISLATVAAYIGAGGLGTLIFDDIQSGFKTEFVAAGAMAIALAIVADILLVIVQRAITPWSRRRLQTF